MRNPSCSPLSRVRACWAPHNLSTRLVYHFTIETLIHEYIYIYIFTWVCIYKYIYLKQTHIKYMYVSVHTPWSWSPPLPQWGGVALPLVGVWKCVGGYANIYPQIMVGLPINNPKAKSIFAETLSSSFPTKCCTIGLPRRWHDMTCTMIPWFILLDWRMIILPYEFM